MGEEEEESVEAMGEGEVEFKAARVLEEASEGGLEGDEGEGGSVEGREGEGGLVMGQEREGRGEVMGREEGEGKEEAEDVVEKEEGKAGSQLVAPLVIGRAHV